MICDLRFIERDGKRILQAFDDYVWFDVPLVKTKRQHVLLTACRKGHEFTPENTFLRQDGKRVCRTCRKGYCASWREKSREKIRAYDRENYWKRKAFKAGEVAE